MSLISKNIPTYPGAILRTYFPESSKNSYSVTIERPTPRLDDYTRGIPEKYTKSMSMFINGDYRDILKFYDMYLTDAGFVFTDSVAMIDNPFRWSYSERGKLIYTDTKEGFVWRYSDPKNTDRVVCISPHIDTAPKLSFNDKESFVAEVVITFRRTFKNSCH